MPLQTAHLLNCHPHGKSNQWRRRTGVLPCLAGVELKNCEKDSKRNIDGMQSP